MSPRRKPQPPTVSDKTARLGRTGVQAGAGGAILILLQTFGLIHLTAEQALGAGPAATVVVNWIQTTVEDWLGKGLLRRVPARPAKVPVVDDSP